MLVFRPQMWTTARILPRRSCFLAGSTGGPCPQAPFGSSLQQTAIQDILLPLETLASSPSIWEVPDFPVLTKEGFITSHKPHVSLLARYSQSRRDEQPNLPGGTGAGEEPRYPRALLPSHLPLHPHPMRPSEAGAPSSRSSHSGSCSPTPVDLLLSSSPDKASAL